MVYLEFMIPSFSVSNIEIIDIKQNSNVGWNLYALQNFYKLIYYADDPFYFEATVSK